MSKECSLNLKGEIRQKASILRKRIEESPVGLNAFGNGNDQAMASTKMRIPLLITSLALCCTVLLADDAAKPGVTPIQAELMADVRAHKLKVGEPVYARVQIRWEGTDCILKNGAILGGQVVSVVPHTKTAADSQLGLEFTKAQCSGLKMDDFKLLVAAVAAPPPDMDRGVLTDALPLNTTASGPGNTGIGALKTMQESTNMNLQTDLMGGGPPPLPPMKMGDVVGIRGMKLSIGSGPDNSSVLTATNHDLTLLEHTVFLMVPLEGTFPLMRAHAAVAQPGAGGASGLSGGTTTTTAPPADLPVLPDIDLCVPPQCDVALPPGNATAIGNAPDSISIGQLGYTLRPQKVMKYFDYEEALAYLGPRELLVTFNPHQLMPRHLLGSGERTVRVIRAALVDTATHKVTHTVDWEMPDNNQYLWPLSEGHVLVHVGSELRVYGAGLKIQNRLGLTGPLAFVRVTPDGSFFAIGVIHERHSAELHEQLRQHLDAEPEEDLDILVLNRNFEPIAATKTHSGLLPPTLLNEGQAKLLAQPDMRYRILMQGWDNHTSTFARFDSSCKPELSSIAPDLIFLVSCDSHTEEYQYRVVRPNGKLALKSSTNSSDFGYAAQGSANHEVFVVKTVQSTRPVPEGATFSAADLTSEALGVYRAADGKRLLNVLVGSPSSSRDGFALAPDGSQLAVLTRDQIAVYPVSVK
jgi:hypothetical protein